MNDVSRRIARRQEGLLATWQLRAAGLSRKAALHQIADLQRLFDGVYLTGEAPPTRRQRRRAATLTTPTTVLERESAAMAYGIRWDTDRGPITVLRPGDGGPERRDGLLIRRSRLVLPDGILRDTTIHDGVRLTTPERTIAALWPDLPTRAQRHKLLREAIRLRRTTVAGLVAHLELAPARNAPKALAELANRYALLRLDRCRSDAEAYAVELIHDAGLPLPDINVRRAGQEADLSWLALRLIIEIDGDSFHADKAADARKSRTWAAARWRVRRVPHTLVFEQPARFVAGVRHHLAAP